MPAESFDAVDYSCLFQPSSSASFSIQQALKTQGDEGMFAPNVQTLQPLAYDDDNNHQRHAQPLRPWPPTSSPAKPGYSSVGANAATHSVSPLHLAALQQPRTSSLGMSPSQPAARMNPDRQSISNIQHLDSSMHRSSVNNNGPMLMARSGSYFNRSSCPGIVGAAAQDMPYWQSLEQYGNNPGAMGNGTHLSASPHDHTSPYMYSQPLPGMFSSNSSGGTQQPQHLAALPTFNNMLGQNHMHLAPELQDPQSSMFCFGPSSLATNMQQQRSNSAVMSGSVLDAISNAAPATRSLCNVASSMRRANTPILSLAKDSPKKDPSPLPVPATLTSLALLKPQQQQQQPQSILQHASPLAPRRSAGVSDSSADMRSVQRSGASLSSLGGSPSGTLTASPAPSPQNSTFQPRVKQTNLAGALGAAASPSKPSPSRLSYQQESLAPVGRIGSMFRSRLASGAADPGADPEPAPQQEGTVKHWRHPPPSTPPPQTPPPAQQQRQQQQEDDGSDDGCRPEEGGLEGSDEEYEEEGPPPPPSERTLLWLEETTRIAIGKAKIPGATRKAESLF